MLFGITSYGTFAARATGFKANPTDPTGREGVADDLHLIEQTDRLCARLGVHFGFAFTLVSPGIDRGIVTRFPPDGIVNPKGERFAETDGIHTMIVGADTVRLYSFDEPCELAAGVWTFEIHHHGTKIAEQRFAVATQCGIS
jgi:hypothetical protein